MVALGRKEQQELQSKQASEFAADVLVGLSSPQKYLASRYFYDQAGSELFEEICLQPEYYPTRVEASILKDCSPQIAATATHAPKSGPLNGISVVELGSGSSSKTRILLNKFLDLGLNVHYFPIDISRKMLEESVGKLRTDIPRVSTVGIPMDYGSGLEHVNALINTRGDSSRSKLILFLGSSIGNFEPKQSVSFLRMIRQKMSPGDHLLVGFDLQKHPSIIDAAYNDRQGVTAKFNLNLLERINRELDGDFSLDKFVHKAFYNERLRRIEMHLVSLVDQDVHIGRISRSFSFKRNETIHTENSYKYSLRQIGQMATQSGLEVKASFMDSNGWFALSLMHIA
jgi:dimethylhistidine N-methyltransferase